MATLTLVLVVLAWLAVAAVSVPTLRSKRKDGVISEQLLVIQSHETRIKALERDLGGAKERADAAAMAAREAETRAAQWQARYEEQSRYTAGPAIENFERLLKAHSEQVAERHALMIESLEGVTNSLGELLLELSTAERPGAAGSSGP